MPGSDEERLVLRALGALIAFVLAAGVATALSRAGPDQAADVPARNGEPQFGSGPLAGTDVPTYVTARRDALDRLTGRAVAVVSFAEYQREGEARSSLRGSLDVEALLVAAPGGKSTAVTGSLAAWAADERAAAEEERDNLVRVLATTEAPEFAAQYREDIARLDGLLLRLDPAGAVVFGAVVEAEAEVLRRLAARADVRLVDAVGRGVAAGDLDRLVGLRPEETARSGDPPTRPL